MKFVSAGLAVALLFVLACFSGCTDPETDVSGSQAETGIVSTVSKNGNGASADASADQSEESNDYELPFVPKEKTDPQESDAQTSQSQEPAQAGDNGQDTASLDPYEGGGY